MIELRIPRTLRLFGYKESKGEDLRRSALLRAVNVAGRDTTLFNLASMVILTKEGRDPRHNLFKGDMDFLVKKIVKKEVLP